MTGLLRFLQNVLAQRQTDLAIRQAELRQGYAIEKELAERAPSDLPNYPNQAGAGEQQQRTEEARRVKMDGGRICAPVPSDRLPGGVRDCNSAPLSKNPLWKGLAANSCGKTGYVASEDSCQVSRPTINPNADVVQAFPNGRFA